MEGSTAAKSSEAMGGEADIPRTHRACWSDVIDSQPVIGRIVIPQCSDLLLRRGVLSLGWKHSGVGSPVDSERFRLKEHNVTDRDADGDAYDECRED
jgi:hypothetical protein